MKFIKEFAHFSDIETRKVSDYDTINKDYEYMVLFFYNPETNDLKEEDIDHGFDEDLLDEALTFNGKVYTTGTLPAIAVKRQYAVLTNSPRDFYVDDPKLRELKDDPNVEPVEFSLDGDADKMEIRTETLEWTYISGSFAVIEV